MAYTVEESGVITRVILTGNLTITYAQRLKDMLEGLLKEKERIVVSLNEVSDIDIPTLQILCAAHKSSVRLNKELTLEGELSDAVNHAVITTGFQREKACTQAGNGSCLWAIMRNYEQKYPGSR
jgi:anti-anti-sigma regulatory factor